MKVELEVDEVWNLFSYVVKQVNETAGLSDDDRAAITRWRSQEMKRGSEEIRVLAQKVNEDLAAALRRQEKSPIRKPDWV
jgi:hypothetical protein